MEGRFLLRERPGNEILDSLGKGISLTIRALSRRIAASVKGQAGSRTANPVSVMNPSYGQGMTLAALCAKALERSLRKRQDLSGLDREVHRRQAKAIAPGWTTTTSSDAQWAADSPEELGPLQKFLHRVSEEVFRLAARDPEVTRTLLEVKNLTRPPRTLLRPGILFPALRNTLASLRRSSAWGGIHSSKKS